MIDDSCMQRGTAQLTSEPTGVAGWLWIIAQ